MIRRLVVVALMLVCMGAAPALARHHASRHHVLRHSANASYSTSDPRPSRWCMWWLRRELGIPKSAFPPGEYNLARAGRFIGQPAHGPAIGVVVVWRHHIGIITGKTQAGWIVKSGNDGHAVRERSRPVNGAIAFRWPGAWASR
jgi:hypothetical protein